jgi:hypothetical protein
MLEKKDLDLGKKAGPERRQRVRCVIGQQEFMLARDTHFTFVRIALVLYPSLELRIISRRLVIVKPKYSVLQFFAYATHFPE